MPLGINTALSNIGPDNATYIKSQSGFADYYSGYGWYGQLSIMDPFLGYQIFMTNSDEFTYPDNGGLMMFSNIDNNQIGAKSCEYLAPTLMRMSALIQLDLCENLIDMRACEILAPALL